MLRKAPRSFINPLKNISPMKTPFVINIGRQLGSGGSAIGRLLAEAMDAKYYDKEILHLAAKESGFTPEVFARHDERKGFFHSLLGAVTPALNVGGGDFYGSAVSDEKLFHLQAEAIQHAAQEHPCIFVGRCADYVLRQHPRHMNVFITADPADRIKRICENMQVSEAEAEKLMTQGDTHRAAYYNFYTAGHWGAAASYHLCLNSSVCGIEGAVEIIRDFAQRKFNL